VAGADEFAPVWAQRYAGDGCGVSEHVISALA
jgi:hypothetical protein